MDRGYNVVVFAPDNFEVTGSETFDIFTGLPQSAAMLSYLQGLPDGSVVAIVAMDAVGHWTQTYTGADLIAYLSSQFGASSFATGGFRDSYGLVSVKGAGSSLFESTTAAGSGAVTVSGVMVSCAGKATPSPTVMPYPRPSKAPIPVPTLHPSMQPIPAPSAAPIPVPTMNPTMQPIPVPSAAPIFAPTATPSEAPSYTPVPAPTRAPIE
jgi:hypothetical protein